MRVNNPDHGRINPAAGTLIRPLHLYESGRHGGVGARQPRAHLSRLPDPPRPQRARRVAKKGEAAAKKGVCGAGLISPLSGPYASSYSLIKGIGCTPAKTPPTPRHPHRPLNASHSLFSIRPHHTSSLTKPPNTSPPATRHPCSVSHPPSAPPAPPTPPARPVTPAARPALPAPPATARL
jgi:hypothetical protein